MSFYVNGVGITDEQVFAEMQYHPASSVAEAQKKAAEALAIRQLLLQEATRLGIAAPDISAAEEMQEDYAISRLLEQEIVVSEPDEVSCQCFYEKNQKTFRDTAGNAVLYEHVKPTIFAYLKEKSWQVAIKKYIQMLVDRANIAGIKTPFA